MNAYHTHLFIGGPLDGQRIEVLYDESVIASEDGCYYDRLKVAWAGDFYLVWVSRDINPHDVFDHLIDGYRTDSPGHSTTFPCRIDG